MGVDEVTLALLGLLWAAVLVYFGVHKLRGDASQKSIESFHTEHEVLSRQGYSIEPVRRLEEPEWDEVYHYEPVAPTRRPHLTVVHDDDTYRSLETRQSWDEWRESYDFDRAERPTVHQETNRYAAAYSSVPVAERLAAYMDQPVRPPSMRQRRRVMFTRLVLAVVTTSLLGFFVGSSVLVDLAILTWVALAAYVALALYALSQGYLHESSLGLGRFSSRSLASVEPLYREQPVLGAEDFDDEFYDPSSSGQWRHDSRRSALG